MLELLLVGFEVLVLDFDVLVLDLEVVELKFELVYGHIGGSDQEDMEYIPFRGASTRFRGTGTRFGSAAGF